MRYVAVACAVGLWVGPALAEEMRLDPPTVSARQDHCSSRQRAECAGVAGKRVIDEELSCSACDTTAAPPLPAEIVSPPAATPRNARPARPPQQCQPRGHRSDDDICPVLPPLDAPPRP